MKIKPVLAFSCFIIGFVIARVFTTLHPSTVLVTSGGIHIHHFWFGLVLVLLGGGLGLAEESEKIKDVGAVFYGFGSGLIMDEVGLLLTMGNYWTSLTFVILVIVVAVCIIVISLYELI